MARKLNLLTALEVKNATPRDTSNSPKLIADGGGLYLQVMPGGSKSFLFRYTLNGKAQTMGLGSINAVSLAEARATAQAYRSLVQKGLDPKVERERIQSVKVDAAAKSFEWCAEQYIETHKDTWSNAKHEHQWTQTMKAFVYPKIGKLPVQDITVHHVMDVLKPIWTEKTETATRVRGRMERILGWAAISGYRSAENPARWKAYLSELLPLPQKISPHVHHPAIPHVEIADFLTALRAQPDGVSVRALEFLTLVACRTGEVIGAQWSEFDFDSKVWNIPAERMKAKRPHVVPLCDRAIEIVNGIKHLPDEMYVFRGVKHGKPISNMAMLQLMRRMNAKGVPHGMRSTFRDWAADKSDVPGEVAEAALAHVIGDKTEAAYLRSDRLDRRRGLMNDWAAYCGTPNLAVA